MPNPRVFVSSTCYDLRYIRESIRSFITSLGYDPVLSERYNVFYNPLMNVQDACLAEVKTCQIFLLVIGGKAGNQYKNTVDTITNFEYREAAKSKIPIFAVVQEEVYTDYYLFEQNKENKNIDFTKIKYPAVDSTKIFEFMEEVQKNAINNALTPFSSFNDLETYLRQQWAAMMFNFLSEQSENRRVASVLDSLTTINERIELIAKQILQIVGSNKDKANAEINEKMQGHLVLNFLNGFRLFIEPKDVIRFSDLSEMMNKLNHPLNYTDKEINFVFRKDSGIETKIAIASHYFSDLQIDYDKLRHEALFILKKHHVSEAEFLAEE